MSEAQKPQVKVVVEVGDSQTAEKILKAVDKVSNQGGDVIGVSIDATPPMQSQALDATPPMQPSSEAVWAQLKKHQFPEA